MGSEARLLGCCFSVLVGVAETAVTAARAERMLEVFILIANGNYSSRYCLMQEESIGSAGKGRCQWNYK